MTEDEAQIVEGFNEALTQAKAGGFVKVWRNATPTCEPVLMILAIGSAACLIDGLICDGAEDSVQ